MNDVTRTSKEQVQRYYRGTDEMQPNIAGDWVLYSDYESLQRDLAVWKDNYQTLLDAKVPAHEPGDAHRYALNLLNTLVDKFGRPEGFTPEDDMLGLLLQIDNVVAGLLKRAAQPPSPEWRSIETAPKDGKTILICGGSFDSEDESYGDMPFIGVSLVYWDSMRLTPHWHGESRDAHDSWFVHKPTHWMPVPAPYSTATKGGDHG